MTLVTALNLIWLLLAAGALAVLACAEWGRSASQKNGLSRRLTCVFLVAVSLFPYVSASDDLIGFAYLRSRLETHNGWGHSLPENSKQRAYTTQLARLLQSLDDLQVTAFFTLFFSLCYFGLVFLTRQFSRLRRMPSPSSRAPPFIALAA